MTVTSLNLFKIRIWHTLLQTHSRCA